VSLEYSDCEEILFANGPFHRIITLESLLWTFRKPPFMDMEEGLMDMDDHLENVDTPWCGSRESPTFHKLIV